MSYMLDFWSTNLTLKQPSVITSNIFFIKSNDKPTLVEELNQVVKHDKKASREAGNKEIESTSHKLVKSEIFMTKTLSTLLDQGWGYIKMDILYDKTGSYITDKSFGSPFIVINGTEKQEQWFLWKAITGKEYCGAPKQQNVFGMIESKHDFAHRIGLSGLSFIVQKVGNYHDLMGISQLKNLNERISEGRYRLSRLAFGNKVSDAKFGYAVGRHAVVYRLIFWNPDQRDVLTGNHRFVIFCRDYHAGKLD